MLLKIRALGPEFPVPPPILKDGLLTVSLDAAGELVKVPPEYVDRVERIVGVVSMGIFPVGLDVKLDPPQEELNGFWVQREVFDEVRKANGRAAISA
jgi:hypothetical protein